MSNYFNSHGLSPLVLDNMVMKTDSINEDIDSANSYKLNIVMIDSSELLNVLKKDPSHYKIVLLWACWSKTGVAEMMKNKYLFDTAKYSIYLVSIDLNNAKQKGVIKGFLTKLGVSNTVYQLNTKIAITDLQNTQAATSFISYMTDNKKELVQLNACIGIPYALVYNHNNKVIRTYDAHFSFSDLSLYKR
jgi:hypothetical protein